MVIHRDLVAGLHARPRTPASTWIYAWLRQRELDRRLAEGGNPTTDALRALRARQLGGRRHRRALAAGLRALVAEACDPLLRRPPVPPLNLEAVHAARDPLLRLARRLVQAENPVPAGRRARQLPGLRPLQPRVHRSRRSERRRPGGNGAHRHRHQPLR